MSGPTDVLDLDWLARRCADLHADCKKPSRREMRGLQAGIKPASGALQPAGIEAQRTGIDALLHAMALAPAHWQEAPLQDALPMAALLPGIGCRILYAKTPAGHWLMEGPDGSQELYHLPRGGLYTAIGAASGNASAAMNADHGSATELFRGALFARKGIFLQAALAALLTNLLALAGSLYSMQVYDRVMPTQGISTLIVLTTGVLLAALLELVVRMARSSILESAVKGMDLELSHRIYRRLLSIRMDQFPASVGTLSAQLRSYELIRSFASSATLYLAVDAPFALGFLVVIFFLAGPAVAAVPAGFFMVALAVGLVYRGRIARHAKSGTAMANRKLGLLVETVEAAESIKASGAGWQLLTRWDALNRRSIEDEARIRHYSEQASYLAASLQQVSYVLLVAAGAYLATSSNLTTGGLVACSILSGRVLAPAAALPGLIVQWAHARSALDNLEKVFALQRDNHAVQRPLTPEQVLGDLGIADLRFTYPGRPATVSLDALHIRAGEKVAIIGAVGAGKSTLLKLLAGLYAPQQGSILLDGLALQQIARSHLSEHIGYLGQEVRLLSGTLRENLLAGLPGVTEQALLDACQATGLAALVASHPQGLELRIAEGGGGVSGGQRQLIAVTRMILSNPSVWLLDEPTTAMDEHSEQRSLLALRQAIAPEETMILITHKPALLVLAERLIVLTPKGVAVDGPRDVVLAQLQQNTQRLQAARPVADLPVREGA